MKRLFLFDVDGTLNTSWGVYPVSYGSLLERGAKIGVDVGILTSRPGSECRYFVEEARRVNMATALYFENGAYRMVIEPDGNAPQQERFLATDAIERAIGGLQQSIQELDCEWITRAIIDVMPPNVPYRFWPSLCGSMGNRATCGFNILGMLGAPPAFEAVELSRPGHDCADAELLEYLAVRENYLVLPGHVLDLTALVSKLRDSINIPFNLNGQDYYVLLNGTIIEVGAVAIEKVQTAHRARNGYDEVWFVGDGGNDECVFVEFQHDTSFHCVAVVHEHTPSSLQKLSKHHIHGKGCGAKAMEILECRTP
jgi:hypothetical protein